MTLKSDVKFEEKLTCGLKMTAEIWLIFTSALVKPQNREFDGILLSKVEYV